MVKVFVTCDRCQGKGNIEAFAHVKGGICFRCRLNHGSAAYGLGNYTIRVSLVGNFVVGNREGGVSHVLANLATLAKLSRKGKIEAAVKEFAAMSNSTKPIGYQIIQLVALARVSDAVLQCRILAALEAQLTPLESVELREVVAEFGLSGTVMVEG